MTPIAPALQVLLGLFALRVFAQLLQWGSPVAWLPPFEVFHGAVLAYWQLLAVQLALLVWLCRIARRHTRGDVEPRSGVGRTLLILGSLYAALVLGRFAVGVLELSESDWFQRSIPTFFHGVLATWVACVGAFHARASAANEERRRRSGEGGALSILGSHRIH